MIQLLSQPEVSSFFDLKNIDKYVPNEKHKLVLKLTLFYKLTPYEIRMLTPENIDYVRKILVINSRTIQVDNQEFLDELKKYIYILSLYV